VSNLDRPKRTIQVAIDIEFTSFESPELLSIGMCAKTGEELYLELDVNEPVNQRTLSRSSTFVQDTVLSQFGMVPGAAVRWDQVGIRLVRWLEELGADEVQLVHDYPLDFELLAFSVSSSPASTDALLRRLKPVMVGDIIEDDSWAPSEAHGLFRHHALADARALASSLWGRNFSLTMRSASTTLAPDDVGQVHALIPRRRGAP
jgi:hypothetical protein